MSRFRYWLALASFVVAVAGSSTAMLGAERVALVIGNGAYQKVPALSNPPTDAADIGASLERLGFLVRKLENADFDAMRRALIEFGREARSSQMAVIFYAGHGIEVGGENWLIPIDAELRNDLDVESETINLRTLMTQVSGASRFGFVLLDACRNNIFANQTQRTNQTRSVNRGLARVEPSDNILVAYAAKDGTVAADGNGRNSPFTAALLKNIETPGLEVTFMLRRVRESVMASTKREQQPYWYGSLSTDEIYLKPASLNLPATPAPQAATPPLTASPPDQKLDQKDSQQSFDAFFDEFYRPKQKPDQNTNVAIAPQNDTELNYLNIGLAELTAARRSKYRIKSSVNGVLVTEITKGSEADTKKLAVGEVLVEVGSEGVNNARDVKKRIDALKKDGKKSVLLLISKTDGELRFVALSLQ